MNKVAFRLGKGWIHETGLIYLYGSTVEASENDERWSVVLRWSDGEWGYWIVNTRLCAICTSQENGERVVLSVGIDGAVQISDAAGVHDTFIDSSEDGPNDLRHITAVRPIAGDVFAVGMSRMVYRRFSGALSWAPMDEGMRLPAGTREIAGFKAIDGDGRGRYLAVGLFGEMWLFEDGQWQQLESPTNVKLEAVRWVDENLVFVAGAGGTLLRGPPRALSLVWQPDVRDTFWSIEWFQDTLFLATGIGLIYSLDGDGFTLRGPTSESRMTSGNLHAAGGYLLSIGSRDAVLYDGVVWQHLTPPGEGTGVPFDWAVS